MRNTGIRISLCALAVSAFLCSCDNTKMAKNSESELLTFKIEEYPDAKIETNSTIILIHMPLEVSDLHMTPIYTISDGAVASPVSGEKRDFGVTAGIRVTSEDNLYFTLYHASVVYPGSKADFNSVTLPSQSEKYGQNFTFEYTGFPSATASTGRIKWTGAAISNRSGADIENPDDISQLQFYPGTDSGLGNMMLLRTGYGVENAAEITFSRPVNPDTLTIVPSALTLYCMKNQYTNDAGQTVEPMNTTDADYMTLVIEGYDGEDTFVSSTEVPIANFSLPERPYIRENWQTVKLKPLRMKNLKKLKLYVKGARQEFYPIFAIDKLTYQVQPELTPSDDD